MCSRRRSSGALWPGDRAPLKEATGCQRGQFRSQRGKAAGNQVGIYEMDHASVLGQKFSRKRGLASAVRTSNHDAKRFFVDALAIYESSIGVIFQNVSAHSNDPGAVRQTRIGQQASDGRSERQNTDFDRQKHPAYEDRAATHGEHFKNSYWNLGSSLSYWVVAIG